MLQTAAHVEPRRATKQEETPSIYALAKEALTASNNETEAATELLFDRLQSDAKLLRTLISGIVRSMSGASVGNVIRHQRSAAFESAIVLSNKAKAGALASVMSSALLDIPLSDGTRLRDATKVEILETADRWDKQAQTMAHRVRFLRAVGNALPAGKRCGDVLTEKKAVEIFKKAA